MVHFDIPDRPRALLDRPIMDVAPSSPRHDPYSDTPRTNEISTIRSRTVCTHILWYVSTLGTQYRVVRKYLETAFLVTYLSCANAAISRRGRRASRPSAPTLTLPYTLQLTPTTPYIHPTYTLHPTPYTLQQPHTTYTLRTPYMHPAPYTLHPTPYNLHPTPYTQHSETQTLHHKT